MQLTNKIGVITWFKINQKQITELFCINKDKPELKCDGKCYLNKSLKNTTDTETTNSNVPNKNKSQIEEVLFFKKNKSNIFLSFISYCFFTNYSKQLIVATKPSIFQPPKF